MYDGPVDMRNKGMDQKWLTTRAGIWVSRSELGEMRRPMLCVIRGRVGTFCVS